MFDLDIFDITIDSTRRYLEAILWSPHPLSHCMEDISSRAQCPLLGCMSQCKTAPVVICTRSYWVYNWRIGQILISKIRRGVDILYPDLHVPECECWRTVVTWHLGPGLTWSYFSDHQVAPLHPATYNTTPPQPSTQVHHHTDTRLQLFARLFGGKIYCKI